MEKKALEDIKLLENFITHKCVEPSIVNNSTRSFSSEGMIYGFTNELLHSSFPKNLDNTKSLVVTSSGDHLLHAVLAGCTDITAFDINRFCKYYSALKIAMIKRYSHKIFYRKISEFIDECNRNDFDFDYIYKLFNDVFPYLNDEEKAFWNTYFKLITSCNIDIKRLFYSCYSPYSSAYRDKKYYNKIKDLIDGANIKYIDTDVATIANDTSKQYDYIHLSNMLEYATDDNIINILLNLETTLTQSGIIDFQLFGFLTEKSLRSGLNKKYNIIPINCDDTDVYRLKKK